MSPLELYSHLIFICVYPCKSVSKFLLPILDNYKIRIISDMIFGISSIKVYFKFAIFRVQ